MTIQVVNENGLGIQATLIAFNSAGQQIEQTIVGATGIEYDRPGEATQWLFTAAGYHDAAYHDLSNYENYTVEMIPKLRWVAPALLGLSAFGLLKVLKLL